MFLNFGHIKSVNYFRPKMKDAKYIEENLAAVKLSLSENVIQDLNHLNVDVSGNRHNTYNLQFIDTES